MTSDAYIIFLTAFAVFGMYCTFEMLVSLWDGLHSPGSVTIIKYSGDEKTQAKVHYLQSTVFNNHIVLITDEAVEDDIYPDCHICKVCEISPRMVQRLFTKKAD